MSSSPWTTTYSSTMNKWFLGPSRRKLTNFQNLTISNSICIQISSVLISFSFLCTLAVASPTNHQIHKQMNEKDLASIFHVHSHDEVPEYQVVNIHSIRSKRSVDSSSEKREVAFNAFGKNLRLSLKRNPHIIKKQSLRMWIADSDPSTNQGIQYHELPETEEEEIGDAYQDVKNGAALLIHHDREDGSLVMDGLVGRNLVVKPIPYYFRNKLNKETNRSTSNPSQIERRYNKTSDRFQDEAFLDDEDIGDEWIVKHGFPFMNDSVPLMNHTQGLHIIYQRTQLQDDEHSDYALMESPTTFSIEGGYPEQVQSFLNKERLKFSANRTKRSVRRKRDAPYVIYPEILVIVDYDGYRLHGGDNLQVKRYFVSFWNGVDLRYKSLKGPKIRISIAGIIISRGRDATPYLERNRVGRDALDSASALTDLGKYLFQERRLPVYDIAVVVTKYDMCRRKNGGRCSRGTAGKNCFQSHHGFIYFYNEINIVQFCPDELPFLSIDAKFL